MSDPLQAGPIITGTITDLEGVLSFASKRSYPAEHMLLRLGDQIDYVYYIVSGEILISSYYSPGILNNLFILREKSMLGLIGLFTTKQTMTQWRTLTPCVCYVIKKSDIFQHAPRELLLEMLTQMASMGSFMSRRYPIRSNTNRHDLRMARFFLHLIEESPQSETPRTGKLVLCPMITQGMASELLGLHPVTFNRILGQLRAERLVGQFTKTRLEILDLAKLKKFACCG